MLSEAERQTIADGLNEVVIDHLVDVIDDAGDARLLTRSSAERKVEPGGWFVNCTGLSHVARVSLRCRVNCWRRRISCVPIAASGTSCGASWTRRVNATACAVGPLVDAVAP